MESNSKLEDNSIKPMVKTKSNKTTKYFFAGPTYKSDRKMSVESTQ